MANTFLRKVSSNIGNVAATVGSYTVSSNTGAVVIGLTVANTSNVEISANVSLYNGITDYYLVKRAPIPAEGALVPVGGDQKIVLQANDSIRVSSSISNSIDVIMTLMETTSGGLTVDPLNFTLTANVSNVNEGNVVGFAVTTTNIPNGTLVYWTTTGNVSASDFTDNVTSGNVAVSNSTATIIRQLTNDATTEGVERFALQLRTDSVSGTVVATSGNVIVNDTSILVTETINLSNLTLPLGTSINSTTTKFVSKSLSFDGTQPDGGVILESTKWETFPLTIECWLNVVSGPADATRATVMYTLSGNTLSQLSGVQVSDTTSLMRYSAQPPGTDSGTNSSGVGVPRDVWRHATFTLYSSTGNVTVADRYEWGFNGTRYSGGSLPTSPVNYQMLAARFLTIGTYGGSTFGRFVGNIGQIRVSNIRRYPTGSTYTVPTGAWTADGNTITLIQAN